MKLDRLIWIDLEMTGLNPGRDSILEIATIVTDQYGQVMAEGPNLVIHHDASVLSAMDDWNQRQHGGSGLVEAVLKSKLSLQVAESVTLEFLNLWVQSGASPMCGNSICQDRRFLARHMPKLEAFFHYRALDVTTLKIVRQAWDLSVPVFEKNSESHRALDDVRASIEEYRHYHQYRLLDDVNT
tara:strand:- start:23 stop:574 length:552 start_codon:yes stop_codon:yes gene_type:complete